MKYNDKYFYQVKGMPVDVQEMNDGSTVEVYYLNEQPFFGDHMRKVQFSNWTFVDEKKYRILVEQGFYEEGKDLFSKDVNEIWLDFWKRTSKKLKLFTWGILLPIMLVYITALILITSFLLKEVWVLVVGVVGMLIISTVARILINKNLEKENILAANKIREQIGLEKFTGIVDNQNKYIEDYYQKLQEEYERADREEQEKLQQNEIETDNEIEEVEVVEETEVVEEIEEEKENEEK